MKGILTKIEKKDYQVSQGENKGKKFSKIEFVVDVKMDDKGTIKTLRGSYGVDFAKKYFEFCKVKTKDLVGKEVGVSLAKRSYEKDGERRVVNFIKYLNVLDEEGNAILMPNEESQDIGF